MISTPWVLPAKEILKLLKSSERGLSNGEAAKRLHEYGTNEIAKKEKRHGFEIFISQFRNPLVLLLIVSAIIAYLLGEKIDSLVIIAIVLLNSLLGFFQEYKAERTLRILRKYVTLKSKVIRHGEKIEIDAKEIVPGDIVYLNIGDVIPADIRLIKVDELSTDEASLTGESLPVAKITEVVTAKSAIPQYLQNMAFMGTAVASGYGYGVVIATGSETFFGKTAAYLKQEPETDFQKNIRIFSNFLLKVVLVMTAFVFGANAILGKPVIDSFLFALALAVGITPEVLPIIMTISLSNGALKMAKKNVIMKKLTAVEDFGNIDTLCCDKTGTITEGIITLEEYITLDRRKDEKILLYGLLCNNKNNPIDKAILEHKESKKLTSAFKKYTIVDENEFDFERRRMSVIAKTKQEKTLFVKGAAESVLSVCTSALIEGKKNELSPALLSKFRKEIEQYNFDGYRVIALAEKPTQKTETTKVDEKDMILLGFMLFLDPPKKDVKDALKTLQELGINIKILSGDHPLVTQKICNEVGLKIEGNKVIAGTDLEKLSDAEFEKYSNKYNIFARVTPEQKYRIVSYLNKEGHIVGFLGDGVNDAPALKAADIGISVDSAAPIAKEAADIILLKKSLKVLADGIIEGRKTFENITKYILNTISANYGNMFTVAISSLFLKFIPLLPSQILFINFLTDIPYLTVSTDHVDKLSLVKPKRWNFKLITNFMIYFGLISSAFDLTLIITLILLKTQTAQFRTAWFIESTLSEIIIIFALRTTLPFFKSKPSKWLILSSFFAVLLAVGITYTTVGKTLFEFTNTPFPVIALIGFILLSYFIIIEITKKHFFKKFQI